VVLKQQQTDGTRLPVREWRFTYGTYIPQDESNKRLRILDQLQVGSVQGDSLPAFTFGYTGYQNKDGCGACPVWEEWNRARFFYPRLTSLDNGYGSVITATYADSGRRRRWSHTGQELSGGVAHDRRRAGWGLASGVHLLRRRPGALLPGRRRRHGVHVAGPV